MTSQRPAHAGYESIRQHSQSFALASRLLPEQARLHAVAVYAWCRRADDAVDLADGETAADSLALLESELRAIYGGATLDEPVLRLFQRTVEERKIPIDYPLDLLAGLGMDVRSRRYASIEDLLEYCYHVAGCVGLMMCHVMGVADERALRNAAHLGIAMQITNVCRDVEEDWARDRLYIPDTLLADQGAAGLANELGAPFPESARRPVAEAIERLLDVADRYYASGDEGLSALSWRCAAAIRAARLVYSSIGGRIRWVGCDPLAGRAFVPLAAKVLLVLEALAAAAAEAPRRFVRRSDAITPPTTVVAATDLLPLR